jgi:hypothetical protein
MKFSLLIGLLTGAAAWIVFRNYKSPARTIVLAEEAAAKLREAWADYHAA